MMGVASGIAQKELGLYATALNNADLVTLARLVAVQISRAQGQVTIDDVREHPTLAEWTPSSPNVWGSVFHAKGWRCVGRVQSRMASNHAREIKVWRWEGD